MKKLLEECWVYVILALLFLAICFEYFIFGCRYVWLKWIMRKNIVVLQDKFAPVIIVNPHKK